MSSDTEVDTFERIYTQHIGIPETADEVRGYWVFVAGILLGIAGILLFLPSAPASPLRELSIAVGGIGLALLIAGPAIRLPLQKEATYAIYAGIVISTVAVLWFFAVFPGNWSVRTGNQAVILLYAAGIGVLGIGAVIVPLLTQATDTVSTSEEEPVGSEAAEPEAEKTVEIRDRELDDLREERGRLVSEVEKLRAVREERDELAESVTELLEERAERDELTTKVEELLAERESLEGELAALRDSNGQFEVYEDEGGQYRWRLRHQNGNIIASSGQGYTRKHNAQKGLHSVKSNALGADVVHADTVTEETGEEALDAVPLLTEVAETSQATFETYEDKAGEWRWRLVHENGNILADSGAGYESRRDLSRAVESVKRNVGPADYLQFDPASFELYRDTSGEWRWRLVHKNGNILADSAEGYTRRRDARRAVERIVEGVGSAEIEEP